MRVTKASIEHGFADFCQVASLLIKYLEEISLSFKNFKHAALKVAFLEFLISCRGFMADLSIIIAKTTEIIMSINMDINILEEKEPRFMEDDMVVEYMDNCIVYFRFEFILNITTIVQFTIGVIWLYRISKISVFLYLIYMGGATPPNANSLTFCPE
ncbi:hypothetical protein FF38_03340 [Lucilia cuprina]|uniref:Uncharacterized protein n=1 Tax=Lucilia cuprina TaxID=7375 RepID=A0A0L0C2F6_LUCCU|nr:hypothetical protein FF38_03340 [Lucilia cuprina]